MTFTENHGRQFREGDSFLYIGSRPSIHQEGVTTHEVYVIGEAGAIRAWIDVDDEHRPFSLGCSPSDSTEEFVTVFADTTVYANPAMTEVACMLESGAVVASERGGGFAEEDGDVYRFMIPEFADRCGADEGYILVPYDRYDGFRGQVWPLGAMFAASE